MFALFFNLYYAMFTGRYNNFSLTDISNLTMNELNKVGEFVTSIFGDSNMADIGDSIMGLTSGYYNYITLISLVLATITSIGIVWISIKGIKRVFGIFFTSIR